MSAGRLGHEEACAAALTGLPHLTPARLRQLLEGRTPVEAWDLVRAGVLIAGRVRSKEEPEDQEGDPAPEGGGGDVAAAARPGGGRRPGRGRGRRRGARLSAGELAREWAAHARRVDTEAMVAAYEAAGVVVHLLGRAGYPSALAEETRPPAVVFSMGTLAALEHPRVALVGTRSATHYGEEVATELGAGLAGAGVSVVSGLALGIDAAAHRGALAVSGAPVLGVVGGGLDVVYPPSNARLWARVAEQGGLLSEAPLGTPVEAWRFPWRNRLLAALADLVVVVESHAAGGSLITVEAAARRGVPVMAVPGSVRSAASAGTNALLADGCPPARDVDDVLVALGLSGRLPGPGRRASGAAAPAGRGPGGPDSPVWAAMEDGPATAEVLLRRSGLELGELAAALGRLEEGGWARPGPGWWERLHGGR